MQIIKADEPGYHRIDPPTREDQLAASLHYLAERYGLALAKLAAAAWDAGKALERVVETLDITSDPETMTAIEEGQEDEEALRRWETDGGAPENEQLDGDS